MGQYWQIFDIDGQVRVKNIGKLGEGLYNTHAHALIVLLSRPVPSKEPTAKEVIKAYESESKGLFKLPLELIERIFTTIDSQYELLAFSMVNRMLYTVGLRFFQDALCKYEVPCAGNRLICLGDYCRDDDLPSGILPEDLHEASTWWQQNPPRAEDEERKFFKYAGSFDPVGVFRYNGVRWFTLWGEADLHRGLISSKRWESFEERCALEDLLRRHYPSDLEWILCNLTKRVYVTAKSVAEVTGEEHDGPFFWERFGLGEILLSQICWSSDPSTNTPYNGPLHRGKWAADRFEITSMDRLSDLRPVEGGGDGEWKDVSEEIVGEFIAILRAEYGEDDWRKYFTRPGPTPDYWDDPWHGSRVRQKDPYDFKTAGVHFEYRDFYDW